VVQYFVHETRVHKYPIPENCNVHYTGQPLHDSPPLGYDKCNKCFALGN